MQFIVNNSWLFLNKHIGIYKLDYWILRISFNKFRVIYLVLHFPEICNIIIIYNYIIFNYFLWHQLAPKSIFYRIELLYRKMVFSLSILTLFTELFVWPYHIDSPTPHSCSHCWSKYQSYPTSRTWMTWLPALSTSFDSRT